MRSKSHSRFWFLLFMASALLPAQDSTADPGSEMAHSVVSAIEKNYLQAHANPKWNIARDNLLAAHYPDAAQAFAGIRKQLDILEDSELNVLSPAEIKATLDEALLQNIGLGLVDFAIDMEIDSGRARVVTPIAGSPAMKAGIEPGDVIVSVNGKGTSEMDHGQVMDLLRSSSPGGTRLELVRGEREIKVTLQPSAEKLQAVQSARKKVKDRWIGYIRVSLFTPDSAAAVRDAVSSLEKQEVSAYVLDLRNDPGGFLSAATSIAGVFTKGTLGYKVRSNGNKEPIEAQSAPLTTKPVAVLINRGTASAAEFLAGALQEVRNAVLVGMPSYGRGQAQIFMELPQGYGIQIPSVQLLTPGGKGFKGKGLAPDVKVEQALLPEAEWAGVRDRQFLTAAERAQ